MKTVRYQPNGENNLTLWGLDRDLLKEIQRIDPDIKKLIAGGVDNTSYNNEACMWIDPLVQAFTYMSAYNIIGEGFTVTAEDPKVTEKIRKFNSKINSNYQTIDDWVIDNWFDQMNHDVGGVWIVKYPDQTMNDPQLWRVPPETLTMRVDYRSGWVKFVQVRDFQNYFNTYEDFLGGSVVKMQKNDGFNPIAIPVDPETTTWVKLFKRPPMASASKFVVFKHIVMFFMRKFGEKMWAPLILGSVGMPGTDQYPGTQEEMYEAQKQLLTMLSKSKNFGYGAIAGNSTVKIVEPKANGEIYLKYMDAMDEQIMYALHASMSLKSGNTVYKGSDEERESRKNFLLGVRKEFGIVLKRLWANVVVPGYDETKINVEWPPIRSSTITDIAKAFETFSKGGVFVDAQERRDVASQIWPKLRESKLTPEQVKKLDDLFITMLAPSQPGESTADVVNKGGKAPKKDTAVKNGKNTNNTSKTPKSPKKVKNADSKK